MRSDGVGERRGMCVVSGDGVSERRGMGVVSGGERTRCVSGIEGDGLGARYLHALSTVAGWMRTNRGCVCCRGCGFN